MEPMLHRVADPRRPAAVLPPPAGIASNPSPGVPFEDIAPNYRALDEKPQPQPKPVTKLPQEQIESIVNNPRRLTDQQLAIAHGVTAAEIRGIWDAHGKRRSALRIGCRHG